jgi:colicin import membrane protein
MQPSVLTRPTDRPPRQESWGVGTTMSLVAHALLVAGLVWGVHWRSKSEPEGVAAELWSAVPQVSAPPPTPAVEPPPPPPPPKPAPVEPAPPPPAVQQKAPDIVTEQEKKRKEREREEQLEKDKAEKAAAQKAAEDKAAQEKAKADADKQKQLEAQKVAKLRQEQLNRMMGQLGAPANSTGTATQTSGPSASYAGRIKARVRPNIVFSDSLPDNPAAEVQVTLGADGTVIGRRITKSSGVPAWDDAVLRAIDRTAVLPTDNGKVYPMILIFRPNE